MKRLKILGLSAVAALAVMALAGAGGATASVKCKTPLISGCAAAGWSYPATTETEWTQSLVTITVQTTGGTVLDTCTGASLSAVSSTAGGASSTVSGPITSLNWGTCTRTTHTLAIGNLEEHHIAGTNNATLTATGGTEVTIDTIFGSCVYGSGAALDIGTATGGAEGSADINSILPKISGNFACPAHAVWTGGFRFTKPKPLYYSVS